jgi:hypothetical protein
VNGAAAGVVTVGVGAGVTVKLKGLFSSAGLAGENKLVGAELPNENGEAAAVGVAWEEPPNNVEDAGLFPNEKFSVGF